MNRPFDAALEENESKMMREGGSVPGEIRQRFRILRGVVRITGSAQAICAGLTERERRSVDQSRAGWVAAECVRLYGDRKRVQMVVFMNPLMEYKRPVMGIFQASNPKLISKFGVVPWVTRAPIT
jgi:hypothetical protein